MSKHFTWHLTHHRGSVRHAGRLQQRVHKATIRGASSDPDRMGRPAGCLAVVHGYGKGALVPMPLVRDFTGFTVTL
jgi:hypothetical protein